MDFSLLEVGFDLVAYVSSFFLGKTEVEDLGLLKIKVIFYTFRNGNCSY